MQMKHDDVAKALGVGSWSELLSRFEAGEKVSVTDGSLELVGEAWDEMRMQFDLVQVRRGAAFVAGLRRSFTVVELADDLLFADMPNTYDDPAMPICCQRSRVELERKSQARRKMVEELREGRRQIAIVVAIVATVMLGLAIRLAAVPVVAMPLLLVSLWAGGTAWMRFGDLRQEAKGQQPTWSIRRSVVAEWVPLHWFGPEHK